MLENLGDCPDISGPLYPEGSVPVGSRRAVLRRISYLRLRCMRRALFTMWCCCNPAARQPHSATLVKVRQDSLAYQFDCIPE